MTDFDVSDGAVATTLATAPLPEEGAPAGRLVKLPHGDRWPTEGRYTGISCTRVE